MNIHVYVNECVCGQDELSLCDLLANAPFAIRYLRLVAATAL